MIKFSNKARIQRAQETLERARKLAETTPSKFDKMTKQEIINELRKTREKLWNEKIRKLKTSARR